MSTCGLPFPSSEYSIDTSVEAQKITGDLDEKEQLRARLKLYKLLMKYPKAICGILPSLIFGAAPIFGFLIFGKVIIELTNFAVTKEDNFDKIKNYSLYMILISIGLTITKFLDSFFWIRVGSELTNDLKSKVFERLMKSEVSYFDSTPIGDILTLLGEESQSVQDSFGITKGLQFQYIGQALVGIFLCYYYCWKCALIATCIIPFVCINIYIFSKFIDRHINLRFIYIADSMTIAEETLSTIRTVRGFNREDIEFDRFMEQTDKSTVEYKEFGNFLNIMFTVIILGVNSVVLGNMYYGATLVDKKELLGGDLMSMFGYMFFGSFAIINLQTSLQGEQKAIHAGARLLDMIEHESTIPFDGGKTIKNFKGHIEFKNVSFKYPTRDVYVLKNVSFEIKPGQMGALVGHSGSGKSTCVQLLERYYDATEGLILLDGHDIKSLDPHWLHKQIGLVSQEPTLFQLTVKENIKYGARDATDEMVKKAAEEANALNFIEKLEGKFDYFVGEKGDTVSGGQRQRIAIARALIKDPVILITDEATSALDAASEKKVQKALDKIMSTRTSVVVAHRLSTIRNANIIYVFDAGEIVEIGTHESLIKNKKGHYYSLVKRQLEQKENEEQNENQKSNKETSSEETETSTIEEKTKSSEETETSTSEEKTKSEEETETSTSEEKTKSEEETETLTSEENKTSSLDLESSTSQEEK